MRTIPGGRVNSTLEDAAPCYPPAVAGLSSGRQNVSDPHDISDKRKPAGRPDSTGRQTVIGQPRHEKARLILVAGKDFEPACWLTGFGWTGRFVF